MQRFTSLLATGLDDIIVRSAVEMSPGPLCVRTSDRGKMKSAFRHRSKWLKDRYVTDNSQPATKSKRRLGLFCVTRIEPTAIYEAEGSARNPFRQWLAQTIKKASAFLDCPTASSSWFRTAQRSAETRETEVSMSRGTQRKGSLRKISGTVVHRRSMVVIQPGD